MKTKKSFLARQKLFACLGLILVAGSLFLYTVELREPWFGVYSGDNHDWLTASTVIVTKNWSNEGALHLRFAMFENPESPEFATFLDRLPYISYPPGSSISVYAVSFLTGYEPSVSLVMAYGLANHLLVAVFLALTVFFFLRSLKIAPGVAFTFSLVPILLDLLLPYPLYFHQNVFFSQQAVILPFVVVVFLEVLRDDAAGRRKSIIDIIQGLVIVYGVFTEWLMVFAAAVIFAKRLFTGDISIRPGRALVKGSIRFLAWPAAGIALYVVYLLIAMWEERGWAFSNLQSKFMTRSGTGDTVDGSRWSNLLGLRAYLAEGYGTIGKFIIYACVLFVIIASAYLLARRLTRKPVSAEVAKVVSLAFIIFIPCALHVLVFQQHAAIHSFSMLKFSLTIAMLPFVLIPVFFALLYRDIRGERADISKILLLVLVIALMSVGLYLVDTHKDFRQLFGAKNEAWYEVVEATSRNIESGDIVFSPDMEVPMHPPQRLSLTMKRVYRLENLIQARGIIDRAKGDYRVVMMFRDEPDSESGWNELVEAADSVLHDGAFYLYFSPGSFRKLLDMHKVDYADGLEEVSFNDFKRMVEAGEVERVELTPRYAHAIVTLKDGPPEVSIYYPLDFPMPIYLENEKVDFTLDEGGG